MPDSINIPKFVYEKFLRFALENANPYDASQNWKECIGLILGRVTNQQITITDIIPVDTGSAVYVDITNYEKVFSLISSNRIDKGEVIVGWAHTHPGLGLFFSSTDRRTQKIYQQIFPLAFGLVLDPMNVTKNFAGFDIYRVDSTGSRTVSVKYHLEEEINFVNIREQIISELYLIPAIPSIDKPKIISDTEISWNQIKISIIGTQHANITQEFPVKLKVILPNRQFIRLDYEICTDIYSESLYKYSIIHTNTIFHETISSGILAVYIFNPKKIGFSQIKIRNLYLTNYQNRRIKMPELCLRTKIQ